MSGDMTDLAKYCATHRNRESHQNGWVELVGKREKKWMGLWYVYEAGPDGTKRRLRRKRILGPKAALTKGQAEDLHVAWLRRTAGQAVATTGRAKVADLCEDYLTMREVDWEEGTRRNTRSLFNNSIIPALGERAVDSIMPEDLKRFMGSLAHRQDLRKTKVIKKGVSTSYATHVLTNLRAVFDLALERGMTTRNPARSVTVRLKVPKQAIKPDKSVFPPQYLPALLNELSIRDRLIVWISILGATRPAELMAVTVADVGPSWIHINKAFDRWRNIKSTKTGTSRFIHLPPEIAAEVHAWIAAEGIGPKEVLFRGRNGRPAIYSNIVRGILRPAAQRAKIPVQDVDFQMLRRSFATISQFVGLDLKAVQAQLGHSKPDMTARVYMQPVDALTISQMTRLEDLLRGRTAFPADVAARIGTAVVIQ
jgi:integrase